MVVAILPFSAITAFAAPGSGGTVTVDGGASSAGSYSVLSGTEVTLTAQTPPSGQVFLRWVCESGGVTFADPDSPQTTFTMGSSDVSVKAIYKDISEIVITSVEYAMTLGAPSVGATLEVPTLVSVNGREHWTSLIDSGYGVCEWYTCIDGGDVADPEDYTFPYSEATFEAGNAYALYADITAVSGVLFSKDCTFNVITPADTYTVDKYYGAYDEYAEPIDEVTETTKITNLSYLWIVGEIDDEYSISEIDFELSGYEEGMTAGNLSISADHEGVAIGSNSVYGVDFALIDAGGNQLAEGAALANNTLYTLVVIFSAREGYEILIDENDFGKVTACGVNPFSMMYDNTDKVYTAMFVLPPINTTTEAVESVDFTLDGYAYGAAVNNMSIVSENSNVMVATGSGAVTITKEDGTAATGNFLEGAHTLTFMISALPTHDLWQLSCENVTLGGIFPASSVSHAIFGSALVTIVTFDLPALDENMIENLQFAGNPYTFVPGNPIEDATVSTTDTNKIVIDEFVIINEDGSAAEGVLLPLTKYLAKITFHAKSNYSLAGLDTTKILEFGGTIPAKSLTYDPETDTMTAVLEITTGKLTVQSVELEAPSVITANGPLFYPTIKSVNGCEELASYVTILDDSMEWTYNKVGNGNPSYEYEEDTFIDGNIYALHGTLGVTSEENAVMGDLDSFEITYTPDTMVNYVSEGNSAEGRTFTVEFQDFLLPDDIVISSLEFSYDGSLPPKAGEAVKYPTLVSINGDPSLVYKLKDELYFEWLYAIVLNLDDNGYEDFELPAFLPGYSYALGLEAYTYNVYNMTFADDVAYTVTHSDGILTGSFSEWSGENHAYVYHYFENTEGEIPNKRPEKIELTLEGYEAGKAANTVKVTATGERFKFNDSYGMGYGMMDSSWSPLSTEILKQDAYYVLAVSLLPEEGYSFLSTYGDYSYITLNGWTCYSYEFGFDPIVGEFLTLFFDLPVLRQNATEIENIDITFDGYEIGGRVDSITAVTATPGVLLDLKPEDYGYENIFYFYGFEGKDYRYIDYTEKLLKDTPYELNIFVYIAEGFSVNNIKPENIKLGNVTASSVAMCATSDADDVGHNYLLLTFKLDPLHEAGSTWDYDENNHWNECDCTEMMNVAPHADKNGDGKCDVCGYDMSNEPGTDPKNPDGPDKKDGLGTGAIVGIVIGSVAVVGIGGFAIFWFVIKKKSWADLLAIFKKN